MDDMISRQAAIETVRKAQSIGQAHRMLVQLPSAQPSATDTNVPTKQPGWIPVTERLPDKSGLYLVTEHTAYGVEVHSRYWNLRPDGSFWSGWHGDEVLAWQPLPTPYREGGQDAH